MKKNLLILLFLLIFFVQIVFASSGHMKLLAVVNSNGTEGGFADLYLDIEEGSGRVFIDTFPLTKVDTQMSTRFAKEIACSFLEFDCNNTIIYHHFFIFKKLSIFVIKIEYGVFIIFGV